MLSHSEHLLEALMPSSRRKPALMPRATRIAVETPVRFRPVGQAGWWQGTTFNMSQSGLIFRAERLLEVDSLVHMTFALPPAVAGRAGMRTEVTCRCQIVRTLLPATSDGRPNLSAKILEFKPAGQPDPEFLPS